VDTKEIVQIIESMTEKVEAIKAVAERQSKDYGALTAEIDKKMTDFAAAATVKTAEEIKAFGKEMQAQFDELATKHRQPLIATAKTIDQAIGDALKDIQFKEGMDNEMTEMLRKDRKFSIPLDTKTMTLSGSLTGSAVASYSERQAIFPAQKVNFRDLVPTTNTETGLYIFYKETATNNNIVKQLEGSLKGENSYALTEVKIVQNYVAGFTTFSKQMATSLPWFQNTLPRLLMRDFFKTENSQFFTTVSAAATSVSSAETDDVKQVIDMITAQMDLNYNVSFGLVSNKTMGKIIKSTYTNGYYSGAGGLTLNQNNIPGVTILGVPILPASWVPNGQLLLIDNDYLERIQVKGLAIELSYENGTNFVNNLVTARIECQEEINLMLAPSATYGVLTYP
jgi:hypothetical protein